MINTIATLQTIINSSFKSLLIITVALILLMSCKKDASSPTPTYSCNLDTCCRLVSSSITVTDYLTYADGTMSDPPSSGSSIYSYNSKNQLVSIATSGSLLGSNVTAIQYDSLGRPSVLTTSSGTSNLIYDLNGNLSRLNSIQSGVSSYTLYTFLGSNLVTSEQYNHNNNLINLTSYTVSGENIVHTVNSEYDSTGVLTSQFSSSFTDFDNNLTSNYVLYHHWPASVRIVFGGSKNNCKSSNSTTDFPHTMYPYNPSTKSTFSYNVSGVTTQEVDNTTLSTAHAQISYSITTTNYNYIGCN